MSNHVRSGVHLPLERAADELIMDSLKGVTSQEAKKDILTPWKEQDRRSREVYNMNGIAEPHIRRGMYHRVANPARPQLNSRDGVARATRVGQLNREDRSDHGYDREHYESSYE